MVDERRLWIARELTGGLGPLVWGAVHLFEQWSAFGGREAFVSRTTQTGHGALATAAEILIGIAPVLAYIALDLILARREEPETLAQASAEDEALARRLSRLGKWGSRVFALFVLYHVAWLWLPKLVEGSDPVRTWLALRDGMGLFAHTIAHAIGLTAFAVHLWQSIPRLAAVAGLGRSPEQRRAARMSGLILAIFALLLFAQLAGWHAAGTGTIWPIE